jgi:hypothetical protein
MIDSPLALLLFVGFGCSLLGSGEPDDIDLDLDPAAPEDAGPRPLVLFAVHSARVLVPLACMDPGWSGPREGLACLELLPQDGVEIDIGGGRTTEVLSPTSVQCISGRALSGLEMTTRVEAWPVVTWSSGPVSWCGFEEVPPGETLEPALQEALQRTAAALDLGLEPPEPESIRIEPLYRVDLDGDHQVDHIVRATWPTPEPVPVEEGEEPPPPPPPPQQEMLALLGGYQAVRFDLPLPQLVELTGAVDVDYDGRCELVVAADRGDGSSVALARWANDRVELVSAYECGI